MSMPGEAPATPSAGHVAGITMKLLLIVPPAMDVALFGAQRFYTNGIKCWDLDGRGRRGKQIPKPNWYAGPLDALLEA